MSGFGLAKNFQCRNQVREVLQSYSVGDEWVLDDFITKMQYRKWPDRQPTVRQPRGRVAGILREHITLGHVSRRRGLHGSQDIYSLVKSVQ